MWKLFDYEAKVRILVRLQCSNAIPAMVMSFRGSYLGESTACVKSVGLLKPKKQDQMIALLDDPSQIRFKFSLAGLCISISVISHSGHSQLLSAPISCSSLSNCLMYWASSYDKWIGVYNFRYYWCKSWFTVPFSRLISPVFRMRALSLFQADWWKPSRQVLDWLIWSFKMIFAVGTCASVWSGATWFSCCWAVQSRLQWCYLALRTLLHTSRCLFLFFRRLGSVRRLWLWRIISLSVFSASSHRRVQRLGIDHSFAGWCCRNPRPQFLKNCHAAVLSLAALEPCVLLDLLPGLFNGSARVGWEVRYAVALASPLLKAVDKSGVADQCNQHLLADPDGFVSRRFGLSIEKAS